MTFETALFSPLNAPAPDIGNGPDTARMVDVGETVTSTFERADEDMFGFTLEAGKIYEFKFDYAPGSDRTVEDYYTFRAEMARYDYNEHSGTYTNSYIVGDDYTNAILPLKINVTGTYFIKAWHHTSFTDDPFDYTFTVNEVTDRDGGTIADATAINVAEQMAGSLDYSGDVDMFEVSLEAGKRYAVHITLGDGSGRDYVPSEILDDRGNVIAELNLNTPDILAFTASEDGTYYLSMEHIWGRSSQEPSRSHLGDYEFQIVEVDDIVGTGTDDRLTGTNSDDIIRAGGGDDKVFSRQGNDVVHLGAGNDYVRAGGGREEFHGGSGHDSLSYYDSSKGVTVNLATNAVSRGWAANDVISGFESISGSRIGHDKIFGTDGANTIRTYGGNDKVYAGGGNDKVYLGSGNDYVRVGGGREEFHGGSGRDTISYYDSKTGVNLNLTTNAVSGSWAVNDIISGFENVSGSKTGSDTIRGTSDANIIKTYGGNDTISAREGNDTIYGGDGNDKIVAGDGNDKVYGGKGNDYVSLGAGDDYVKAGGGRERFDGGSGSDYVSYYDSTGGVWIDLAADSVTGAWGSNDTIKNFESASGSSTASDTIYGTTGANTLKGYGGNDKLYGRSGSDRLKGGSGNDSLYGGNGDDILEGESGNDYLSGGDGRDSLNGNGGNDRLFGGSSRDTLIGESGNDYLYGETGNDTLNGGAGADRLDGGAGDDRLTSGTGADVFHFDLGDGNDTITDFDDNIDTLELDGFRDTDGDGNIALIWGSFYWPYIELRFDNGQVLTIEGVNANQINDDIIQL